MTPMDPLIVESDQLRLTLVKLAGVVLFGGLRGGEKRKATPGAFKAMGLLVDQRQAGMDGRPAVCRSPRLTRSNAMRA
jgi:hypothetical protein